MPKLVMKRRRSKHDGSRGNARPKALIDNRVKDYVSVDGKILFRGTESEIIEFAKSRRKQLALEAKVTLKRMRKGGWSRFT